MELEKMFSVDIVMSIDYVSKISIEAPMLAV